MLSVALRHSSHAVIRWSHELRMSCELLMWKSNLSKTWDFLSSCDYLIICPMEKPPEPSGFPWLHCPCCCNHKRRGSFYSQPERKQRRMKVADSNAK